MICAFLQTKILFAKELLRYLILAHHMICSFPIAMKKQLSSLNASVKNTVCDE